MVRVCFCGGGVVGGVRFVCAGDKGFVVVVLFAHQNQKRCVAARITEEHSKIGVGLEEEARMMLGNKTMLSRTKTVGRVEQSSLLVARPRYS